VTRISDQKEEFTAVVMRTPSDKAYPAFSSSSDLLCHHISVPRTLSTSSELPHWLIMELPNFSIFSGFFTLYLKQKTGNNLGKN